jgi:hypothetical protein
LSNHLKCHTHRPPFSNGGSEGWKMEKLFRANKIENWTLSLSLSLFLAIGFLKREKC